MSRTSVVADLRLVLAERDFRRLFATRLVSQFGDGVFTAGLGAYVFFNATSFPNPAAGAAAFAVLYGPYSLIGPFAGVLIDRWSRRQILVVSAVLRAAFVVLTAALVLSGSLGVPLYASSLAVLGLDRFFLSSLSAALPHVVAGDKLVIANSMAPTAGGILAFVGGLAGLGVHLGTGGGRGGSAVTLLVAGGCYFAAGLVGATMGRDLLGPDRDPVAGRPAGILAEFAAVAAGLVAGARYVARRRGAAAALGVTGGQRFLYGILFLMSILLYRNYFYRSAGANVALSHYLVLVAAVGVGYGCAALVTPPATRRMAKPTWIVCLLTGAAVAAATGATFLPAVFLIIGFVLSLCVQAVAICATTIIQEDVDDAYRGRVFSFYDMMFNVTFVIGAALAAAFMPLNGKSYALLTVVAAGYLVTAVGYALLGRQPSAPGRPGSDAGGASPSAAAQRSSS